MIIDVSKWNGTIDWKKVKADGVDTVFIRCGVSTEKKCQTDSKFKTYIKGALAQGLKVGLYYYSFSKTEAGAKQEADYCRKICAPYKDQLTYPIYIDIEEESCVKYAKTVAQAFCGRMKAEGWEAGVYTTTSVFKNQLKNRRHNRAAKPHRCAEEQRYHAGQHTQKKRGAQSHSPPRLHDVQLFSLNRHVSLTY